MTAKTFHDIHGPQAINREDQSPFTYERDEGCWAISMRGYYTEAELEWALRALRETNKPHGSTHATSFFAKA